jgi:hypothetical protein
MTRIDRKEEVSRLYLTGATGRAAFDELCRGYESEIADLRHDVERAVASASDLATELVRKDAALREALPFVESTYENESGEEAADAKYVMDKITAALEQSNG